MARRISAHYCFQSTAASSKLCTRLNDITQGYNWTTSFLSASRHSRLAFIKFPFDSTSACLVVFGAKTFRILHRARNSWHTFIYRVFRIWIYLFFFRCNNVQLLLCGAVRELRRKMILKAFHDVTALANLLPASWTWRVIHESDDDEQE